MRIVIYILMVFIFGCTHSYKKAVSDFYFQGCHISIDVTNKEDTIPIVIENADLYNLLNCNGLLSRDDYIQKVYPIIIKGDALYVKKEIFETLKEYKLIEVVNKRLIESLAKSKKIKKINMFFRGGTLFPSDSILSPSDSIYLQERYLIYCLFKEKILVKTDDEPGVFVVRE